MANYKKGAENGNWKGGRSIAPNGYVRLYMPDHHLAMGYGYVYEHRLVAEQKLGRRLQPGEHPHHINGIKTDNRPENLEILTEAEHYVRHRRYNLGLRLPNEPNPMIACACGCGAHFLKFDDRGRPRRFSDWGHRNRLFTVEQRRIMQKNGVASRMRNKLTKAGIIVLCLLSVSSPARAEGRISKALPIILWTSCQAFDSITTAVALRNPNLREGNPFLRGHIFAVKLSVNVGLGFLQHAITTREPTSRKQWILPLAMAGSGCLAGGLNTRTIRNLPK